jgi:hypothetical protein
LWCAAGRNPTDIAAALFCARSSVHRTGRAYRRGALGWEHDAQGPLVSPVRNTVLLPPLRRSLLALLKAPPGVWGVPHALELCHAGPDPAGQPGPHGLGRDQAPLAPCDRLGLEAVQAGRQRR